MGELPENGDDDVKVKRICQDCIGEAYLKQVIASEGVLGLCTYCEQEAKTLTIDWLAGLIEQAFDTHYEQTSTEPDAFELSMMSDRESNYLWEREGQPVLWAIADAADITETVARDILSLLQTRHFDHEAAKLGDECPFDEDSHYSRKDPGCDEWNWNWRSFEARLKTETRYFSRSGLDTLDEIFAGLPNLRTRAGAPVVVGAGPAADIQFLYRARVFAAEDEKLKEALKYPWLHLGPPPMSTAASGRMNARGISVFYGAVEPATALAEVRPPVGSRVAVAKFVIERPLRLLDVEALRSVATSGSIFDPTYVAQVQRARFLEILSVLISRPVMPNEEALEYLATQAIADYLATEARLDGIVFPSVQVGHASPNVVLFHHASRVHEIQLPKDADLTALLEMQDSDGVSPDYRVWEEVGPEPAAKPSEQGQVDYLVPWHHDEPFDTRPASLSIDLASVSVHHINAVSFLAKEHRVDRHRINKSGPFQ